MSEQLPQHPDEGSEGLPPSWELASLGAISEIQSGVAKDSKKRGVGYREVPYLRVANVQRGWLDLDEVKTIFAPEDKIEQTLLRPGDVLFNEGGDRDKLGRGWVWNGELKECIHQNHVFRARLRGGVLPKYVSYYGNSWGRDYFIASGKQTTNLASINQSMLKALPVRLAPLPEQHRIVAEIERQFTRLDAAVATLNRVQANLGRARASVLKAAVEGRLVPTEAELARAAGQDYEPASVLLERILEERERKHGEAQAGAKRNKRYKRYKPPVAPDLDGLPDLPEGWTWASVDAVGDVLLGRQRAPQYLTGRWTQPYLRVANIKDDAVHLSDVDEMDFAPDHLEKYRLQPGDILVSEGQSPHLVGQSAIYRGGVPNLCFQKSLHRFRPLPSGPSAEFAQLVFRAHVKTRVFMKVASITTNIAHLTLSKFLESRFPLPPEREQERIVADAHRRLSVLDALEALVVLNLQRCERLRQSILKRAFEGKLVPQDPNDEPASELLARIQAQSA